MAMSDTPAKHPVYFHQQRLDETATPDVIRQAEQMLQSSQDTPKSPTPEEHKSVSDVTDDGGEGLANLKAALNNQLLDLENLFQTQEQDTNTKNEVITQQADQDTYDDGGELLDASGRLKIQNAKRARAFESEKSE